MGNANLQNSQKGRISSFDGGTDYILYWKYSAQY